MESPLLIAGIRKPTFIFYGQHAFFVNCYLYLYALMVSVANCVAVTLPHQFNPHLTINGSPNQQSAFHSS